MGQALTQADVPQSVAVPATASDFAIVAPRAPTYRIAEDALQGKTGARSFVARGIRAGKGDAPDVPYLVHVNGESQVGLPLAHVATAIRTGVISAEEIAYLQSLPAIG